jgi:nicotinamidase-related amidase
MKAPPRDPHGCAPERAETVLLLIDVINPFNFPESGRLLPFARKAADHIARLKARLRRKGIPALYVNDNFGRWRSDFRAQIDDCLAHTKGAEIARRLLPTEEDYFVLKPKHSAFFGTSLDILLHFLGAHQLILTGFAGDICVRQTANDAYMRDFQIIVPADCVASETAKANRLALRQIERFLKADIRPSTLLRLPRKKSTGQPATL